MKEQRKAQPKEVNQKFGLSIINLNSAAIDVGSTMMMISYSDRQGKQFLLEIDAYTEDLTQLADTLKSAGVTKVAMEATGPYWQALFSILEKKNVEVTLINPKHFKNTDAQKTDVIDSQWLHQLHAHGLLRPSHIATEEFRELRSYIHERGVFQQMKSDTLNRIQKTLTVMNIKYQHLISDIEGVIGMQILNKIADGITNPETILDGLDIEKLKASREDLVKSLTGFYHIKDIRTLRLNLEAYNFYKKQMKQYEAYIEESLQSMLPLDENGQKPEIKPKTSYVRKNQYSINIKEYLKKITGIDLTAIVGLEEKLLLEIISVTGLNINKWPTEGHFTSWLNLAARPKISGGKILGYQKRFTNNLATQAFRLGAQSLWNSKSTLGHLYRRLSAQKGSKKAIKAVARRLATIFYIMLKNKVEFDPERLKTDTEKQRQRQINRLRKEASKLGLMVTSV